MGGFAAAVDGSLPPPLQQIAHVLFGAPPPADPSQGNDATGGAPDQISTEMSASTPTPLRSPATPAPTEQAVSDECSAGGVGENPCDVVSDSGNEPDDLAQSGASASGSGQAEPVAPAEEASSSPSATGGSSTQHWGPSEKPDDSPGKPAGLPEKPGDRSAEPAEPPEDHGRPPAKPAGTPDDPGPPTEPPGSPQLLNGPPAEAGTPRDLPATEPAGRGAALTRPG